MISGFLYDLIYLLQVLILFGFSILEHWIFKFFDFARSQWLVFIESWACVKLLVDVVELCFECDFLHLVKIMWFFQCWLGVVFEQLYEVSDASIHILTIHWKFYLLLKLSAFIFTSHSFLSVIARRIQFLHNELILQDFPGWRCGSMINTVAHGSLMHISLSHIELFDHLVSLQFLL